MAIGLALALAPALRLHAADTSVVARPPPVFVSTTGVLRAVLPKVALPVAAPLIPVTYYTGNHVPLFQENEQYFITLADTEYEGPRLCAFPLKPRGSQTRSGWVTPEGLLFFAYRTTSTTGLFLLDEGDELKVVGESAEAYQVIVERFQHKAALVVSKATPGARYVYVPPPPPPKVEVVKKPVRRYVITASGPYSADRDGRSREGKSAASPAEGGSGTAGKEESFAAKVSGMFSRLWSREPARPAEPPARVPSAAQPTSGAAAIPPAGTGTPPAVVAAPVVAVPPAKTPVATAVVAAVEQPKEAAPAASPPTKESRLGASAQTLKARLRPLVRSSVEAVYRYRMGIQVFVALAVLGGILLLLARRGPAKSEKRPKPAKPLKRKAEAPPPELGGAGGEAHETAAEAGVHFAGSLESMSLGSVAQFLNSDKESGILTVKDKSDKEVGAFIFVKGEILDATSGSKRGVAAVYEMIRRHEGFFSFARKQDVNPERTVDQGTISLVLDAYRIMDEDAPSVRPG